MARHAALLRGINLGSHNRLKMADLRAVMQALGFDDPETLLQSGNVVYTSTGKPAAEETAIRKRLAAYAGVDVDVMVRTHRQLASVVAHDPLRRWADEHKHYHVVFLSAKPPAAKLKGIDGERYLPERFAARGREIYAWWPNGAHRAKLTHSFFEKQLGLRATARNWNTVAKLADLTASPGAS